MIGRTNTAGDQSPVIVWRRCDWLDAAIIDNSSNLTHKNQILKIDFICSPRRFCKISSQIIECKTFAPYELSIFFRVRAIAMLRD